MHKYQSFFLLAFLCQAQVFATHIRGDGVSETESLESLGSVGSVGSVGSIGVHAAVPAPAAAPPTAAPAAAASPAVVTCMVYSAIPEGYNGAESRVSIPNIVDSFNVNYQTDVVLGWDDPEAEDDPHLPQPTCKASSSVWFSRVNAWRLARGCNRLILVGHGSTQNGVGIFDTGCMPRGKKKHKTIASQTYENENGKTVVGATDFFQGKDVDLYLFACGCTYDATKRVNDFVKLCEGADVGINVVKKKHSNDVGIMKYKWIKTRTTLRAWQLATADMYEGQVEVTRVLDNLKIMIANYAGWSSEKFGLPGDPKKPTVQQVLEQWPLQFAPFIDGGLGGWTVLKL